MTFKKFRPILNLTARIKELTIRRVKMQNMLKSVDKKCLKKENCKFETTTKFIVKKQDPNIQIKYMKSLNKIHLKEV
jgi:hypothetical protein